MLHSQACVRHHPVNPRTVFDRLPITCHLSQGFIPPCSRYMPNHPDTSPIENVTSMLSYTSALMSLFAKMQFAGPFNLP